MLQTMVETAGRWETNVRFKLMLKLTQIDIDIKTKIN
jgi:hypothetical protein